MDKKTKVLLLFGAGSTAVSRDDELGGLFRGAVLAGGEIASYEDLGARTSPPSVLVAVRGSSTEALPRPPRASLANSVRLKLNRAFSSNFFRCDLAVQLLKLTNSTLKKLSGMTDADYERLELYPDFDE